MTEQQQSTGEQRVFIGGLQPDSRITADDLRGLLARFPAIDVRGVEMRAKRLGNGADQLLCYCRLAWTDDQEWRKCKPENHEEIPWLGDDHRRLIFTRVKGAKTLHGSKWRGSRLRIELARPDYRQKLAVMKSENAQAEEKLRDREIKKLAKRQRAAHAAEMSLVDQRNYKQRKVR